MMVNIGLIVPAMAQYSAPVWATMVAGLFMLIALSLSMYLIFEHLSAYNNPEVSSFCFCVLS
jgi:predicted membrane chloride channel (bestrophin family)